MKKPNVLVLMADEQPVFMLGCYGHRSVKTPVIDALAARGARFDAAYCASPICAPCRASMMTGRYVHNIEVWDNAAPLRADWPTFAHSFSAAGYKTILCGKMHFVGPDQHHGFDERWTKDIYPATMEWTMSNRDEVAVNNGQNIKRVFQAGLGRTRDMPYDDDVMMRFEEGIRRMASEESDQPFLLCLSLTGPHYPFNAPEEYWNQYSDEDVDLPEIPEGYREKEHPYIEWTRKHGMFDQLVPDDKCRDARHAILARTTMVDDYFGRVLGLVEELGMDEDLLTVYTSDHGDMMGEHGLWFKNVAYEWSSRVPFVVAGPGVPQHVVSEPLSLVDLGPTLCGLAGVESVYDKLDGRDMSDLVRDERPSGPGMAIVENYAEGVWRGVRTIRRGQYKLTYIPGMEPEMFDLEKDPNEWNNVAADPAYQDIRKELVELVLKDWDPDACDERRWQSEERRLAILKAGQKLDWHADCPTPPEPLPQ